MFARRTSQFAIAATMFALVAFPGAAMAGNPSSLSPVDTISKDVSADGTAEQSSPASKTSASDSPTVDSYGGGTDSVPPPVDCSTGDSSSDSGSTSGSGSSSNSSTSSSSDSSDSSDSSAKLCKPIVECSPEDTDGKDATGASCVKIVECSTDDTDGKDALGASCVKETPPCEYAAPGEKGQDGVVCGGGGVDEETPIVADAPVDAPIVEGGGTPEAAPIEAAGGGGPELPFTGLPLWYAIYGGLGLVLLGAAMWFRGFRGGNARG